MQLGTVDGVLRSLVGWQMSGPRNRVNFFMTSSSNPFRLLREVLGPLRTESEGPKEAETMEADMGERIRKNFVFL